MRLPIPLFIASIAAGSVGLALTEQLGAPPVAAHPSPAASGPTVALLVTRPGAGYTSLTLARAGESTAPVPVARFDHADTAAVKGAILPGTSTVLAVADTAATRDPSFASSLFRIEPHRPAERLCDGLVYASRPLVTAAGRVFVSRGTAGPELTAAPKLTAREDALAIDEIDPATGSARTVHTFSGYLAFLAGEHGREILVYRIGAAGADLIGVDEDTGNVRVIAPSILPFARDFSVDAARGAVVFQERDERDSRTWVVDRLDLATGARTRLATSSSMSLAPSVWPGGGVAYAPDSRGLTLIGREMKPIHAPTSDGVDQVQATSREGAWVAALHTRPGELPVAFAIESSTGRTLALPSPPDARVAIAGFVTEGAAQ